MLIRSYFLMILLLTGMLGCGQEVRTPTDLEIPPGGIKALSQTEIEGFLAGQGMGFAKAAELNHYPGPRHVLALADQLHLDETQQAHIQDIFRRMESEAMRLGKEVVAHELALDRLFAQSEPTTKQLYSLTESLAQLYADLRFAHLNAHLKTRDILTSEQIHLYDQLRGYTGTPGAMADSLHHQLGTSSH